MEGELEVTPPAEEEAVNTPKEEEVEKKNEETETVSVEDIVSGKAPTKKGVDTTPAWAKRRFDELTAKIYEKDREINELKSIKTVQGDRPIPPVESDFIDPQEYRAAMIKYDDDLDFWKSRQYQSKAQKEAEEQERTQNSIKFTENSKRMREKYADYDEVVDTPVFTKTMQDEIIASDFGPEIGYFLAKNPIEAQRLGELSPIKLAKEIGRLEVKFSLATKKFISNAPNPIVPIKGDDVLAKDPAKMTDDEWFKWDKEQKLKKLQSK